MARIGFAIMLILIGTGLFLESLGVLPENLGNDYLRLVRRYWPIFLVLFGIKLIVGEKWKVAGEVIRWLILFLLALWAICQLWGHQEWII